MREVGGGRSTRQPGQVRKEAALTSPERVIVPASHLLLSPRALTARRRAGETRCLIAALRGPSPGTPSRPMSEAGTGDSDRVLADKASGAYRVLARTYRPTNFYELIGQEPMVRTLTNAFATGRIAQAWMLTGVRGVGKTTTARILARALNYKTATVDRPSVDLVEIGEHCRAIMEGRHVD